jgi:ankyrin repeat protein
MIPPKEPYSFVFPCFGIAFSTTPRLASASQALLDKGADVNGKDNNGVTALMFAEAKGHNKVVNLLRRAGAR